MWFHGIFALRGRTPEGLTVTHITSAEVRYWHRVLPWSGGYYSSLGKSIGNIHQAPAAAHSPWNPFILVCVGVSIMIVVMMWPGEGIWEVQRHSRMRIWGDTPIKGPPAFTPCLFMRHQETCSRSPDAFALHCVLTRLKVAEKPLQRVRLAGPPLGKS